MKAYPEKVMALLGTGETGAALRLCEQYCRESPGQAEAWFLRAGVQSQLGALDEVAKCCRKVVELSPGHVGAWYNLGVALQGLHQHEQAADAYAKAISLNPAYLSAYINIAAVLRQIGRKSEALRYARAAVKLDPRQFAAVNNLGLALLDQGEYNAAIEQFDAAARLDPGAAGPRLNKCLALGLRGDRDAALGGLAALMESDPGNAEVVKEAGKIQRRLGRLDDAIATYRAACERHPENPEFGNLLGLALVEAGRPQDAIVWVERALAARADYAEAYNTLAGALHALGDIKAASTTFERAIAIDPRCALAHNNLGLLLQEAGDHAGAERHFRAALAIEPASAEFENNLGTVLMSQGRFDEAIATFRSAITHNEGLAAAWNNLGNALLCVDGFRENFPEANKAYLRAIELQPDFAEACYHYGTCLQQQGRFEEAYVQFGRATALRPDYPEASAGQVMVLERLGRIGEAEGILHPLLQTHQDNVLVALAFGVLAKHLDKRELALSTLERLDPEGLEKWGRIQRDFVLGDLYNDAGDYDRAFAHYHAANTEDHPGYSVEQTERLFTTQMQAYAHSGHKQHRRSRNRSKLPVFIVGMPRSGTTLLEQILASHPDVHGAGELEDIYHLSASMQQRLSSALAYPHCMREASQDALDRIATEYLEQLSHYAPGAKRIVDKMPHNFEALGLIDTLFPGARVIHCMRNPIDTCLSIYFKHFNSFHPYASDLKSLGLYYRQYERLMAHWKRTLTIPIMDVQYEEVVANQEEMSRRIIEFIGLDWNERCLNYHELDRTVNTPSYDQVRKPIYTGSVERWRRYEKHLGPLLEVLDA
ncbi:MAG: tetratricopeptide repeat protein [Pseudomonadota bacterium]